MPLSLSNKKKHGLGRVFFRLNKMVVIAYNIKNVYLQKIIEMSSYIITIEDKSPKGKKLLALLKIMGISFTRYDAPGKEIKRELTAEEEKEAFLYTSKIFASRAFAGKI